MSSGIRRIAAKKSPFQLQILKLYADFVRLAKNRPGLLEKVRKDFREGSKLNPRQDSLLIDYKLRRAKNQLSMIKTSFVTQIHVRSASQDQEQEKQESISNSTTTASKSSTQNSQASKKKKE